MYITSLNRVSEGAVFLLASRGNACGIDDYVVKPFGFNALLEKIENVLENKGVVPQEYKQHQGRSLCELT